MQAVKEANKKTSGSEVNCVPTYYKPISFSKYLNTLFE